MGERKISYKKFSFPPRSYSFLPSDLLDPIRDNRHNRAGDHNADGGGKGGSFDVEPEERGDERTRPGAGPGQWNGDEKDESPVGVLFDLPFVLFDLAAQERGEFLKSVHLGVLHPKDDLFNQEQNEWHRQKVAEERKEKHPIPGKPERATERDGAAALDNGDHGAKKNRQLFAERFGKKAFDGLDHSILPPSLCFVFLL